MSLYSGRGEPSGGQTSLLPLQSAEFTPGGQDGNSIFSPPPANLPINTVSLMCDPLRDIRKPLWWKIESDTLTWPLTANITTPAPGE